MLMLNFDFYDMYAVLVAFRANPRCVQNTAITKSVISAIETPQKDNTIEDNSIRKALAGLEDIDQNFYRWIHTKNIYTYGHRIIKDALAYQIMTVSFSELLRCLNNGNFDQFQDLADALHNVPIILADKTRNTKRLIKKEISWYRKKWDKSFLKEFI